MELNLSGNSADQLAAFRRSVRRVRDYKRKTTADHWLVGRELLVLREIVRGLKGVNWGDVYAREGFSQSTQSRLRRLATAYDSAEEAGRYTSINKALNAAGENPEVCPNSERDVPGCKGAKNPEYEFCLPCARRREENRLAAKRARDAEAAADARLLDAVRNDDVGKEFARQLAHVKAKLEAAEKAVAERDERIALLQQAVEAAAETGPKATPEVENGRISTPEVENDWPVVEPKGESRAVAEHCLRGRFKPWLIRCRGKRPVAGWRRAEYSELRPGENLAAVPGSIGMRVLDVDAKDGVPVAWSDLAPLIDALGVPAFSMRSLSGQGWHLWYRTSRRVGNRTWRYGGLSGEIRDSAGYVVMTDPDALFEKLGALREMPPVDDWSALMTERDRRVDRPVLTGVDVSGGNRVYDGYSPYSGLNLVERVATAPKGTRNNALNSAAYIAGLKADDRLLADLISTSTLDTGEVEKTAPRAFRDGLAARGAG